MSIKTQAKVLRALQEQVVEPVGGQQSVKVDVRVIAATNKDLAAEIRHGRFREDLYFRLNVIPVFVPPLRERGDDVIRLAQHFVAEFSREYGRRPKTFSAAAMDILRAYRWPGNVRELRNTIERLMIMVPGEVIEPADLAFLDVGAAPVRASAGGEGRAVVRSARRLGTQLHPDRVGARSTATSRGRRTRWVSSAAISTRRCGRSASRPRETGKTQKQPTTEPD